MATKRSTPTGVAPEEARGAVAVAAGCEGTMAVSSQQSSGRLASAGVVCASVVVGAAGEAERIGVRDDPSPPTQAAKATVSDGNVCTVEEMPLDPRPSTDPGDSRTAVNDGLAASPTRAAPTDVSTTPAVSGAASTTRAAPTDVSTTRAVSGAASTTCAAPTDVSAVRASPTDETALRVVIVSGEALVEAGLVPRSRVTELLAKDVEHSLAWKLATVEALKIRKAKLYGPHVSDPARKAAVDAENELVLSDLPRSPPVSRDRDGAPSKSTKARTALDTTLEEEVKLLETELKAMRAATQRPVSRVNVCVDEGETNGVEAGRVFSGSPAIRVAAASAIQAIQDADWRGSARTRRTKRRGAESDEPVWTEEILERLVDRKYEDGVVFYRVEWTDYEGDDRFSWEPAENLTGHEKWMKLINHYKDQVEGRHRPGKVVPKSLAAWLKTNLVAVALGDEAEMRCFFLAVRAAMDLLNLPMFDVEGCVSRLDKTVFSRVNSVAAGASVDVMKDLVTAGLEIDCDVWSVNLYHSELGKPKEAVKLSIAGLIVNDSCDIDAYEDGGDDGEDSPVAVFMVATMDKMRVGHVWVLDVTKMGEMTVTDNGVLKAFSDIRVSEVLWVRRCVARVGVQDLTKVKSVGVQRAKALGVGGFPRSTGEVGAASERVGLKRRDATDSVQSEMRKKAKA